MSDQTQTPADQLDPAATDETNANARDGAAKRRDPKEPTAVVGLGASAGGIAVLQQFFADMPPDSGLAFVVVMHLSPEHESQLAKILQSKTAMPVMQVAAPVKVEPNHVYVIPPNKQLTFNDSMLTLVEPQQAAGRRVTIDLFFRTLAQSYGQRSIGVILSGTDSDGVIGLKHVRAQGGLTVAQDPKEAEYPSMPVTAIATGMVDWVLPVAELAPRLTELVRNEHAMRLPPEIPEATEPDVKVQDAAGGETVSDETRDQRDETALQDVLRVLQRQTGHDFSHYKRATLLRRIARRMQVNSVESIPQYFEFFRQHPAEASELLQDLLIGVTHFFRDQAAFAALEANVPQLFAGKKKEDQLRVWVAGCATGEEAYSIAMLLCEHAEKLDSPPAIQIFATDIDEQAVHIARSGIYPPTIEADVSPERLRRFFTQDHGRHRIRKNLREKVLFAAHNVLSDAPFSNLDLVSCRNLLIYLTPKAQEQVFEVAHFALRSGGLLFIGGSENTSTAQPLFAPVDGKHRLYVRRSVPRPTWKVPMVPRRADDGRSAQARARLRVLPPMTSADGDGAAMGTRESAQAGQDRRAMLFGELHLKLLEQYAPPSVVVNDAHDIVHLSENAGRYLQFAGGEPTANLPKVIHPALRLELRTALFRAGQTKAAVNASPVTVASDGGTEVITLSVRPVHGDLLNQGFYLVTFAKTDDAASTIHALPSLTAAGDGLTGDMQAEIESLKRQLAEIAEQYELSSEELKASNEELQAMNEEMRSATEELETSKEELQSINEELVTVNNELKNNVEELSKSNADLNNLMSSTDIGTIFLDRQLRIDRFTPSAQKIFNLIPADVGRPISDITSKLAYDGLFADAEKVLENLQPIEREMPLRDGAWLMSRIAPYRTADDRIAGIVATFVDITRRKRAEDELRDREAQIAADLA
ncbi:MAG TPA: chemotaxis protein CheB, partial [Chthoniobacterales bacterium]